MKKIINKLFCKLIKNAINKSVNDVVSNPDAPEVEPITVLGDNSNKDFWKFILQILISILTAILTALGASSCVNALM